MTTILRRKYRVSRRQGKSLWGRAKDAVNKRNYPPGQHGNLGYKKPTDFGKQLAAHVRLKTYYGMSARQLRNVFAKASVKKGDRVDNFAGLLESRLSSVLYNSALVPTIFAARQLISHKHVTVNGKVINISSYIVKVGDIVKIRDKAVNLPVVVSSIDSPERRAPDYLQVDTNQRSVQYLRVPKYVEIPYAMVMEINLVVERYSR